MEIPLHLEDFPREQWVRSGVDKVTVSPDHTIASMTVLYIFGHLTQGSPVPSLADHQPEELPFDLCICCFYKLEIKQRIFGVSVSRWSETHHSWWITVPIPNRFNLFCWPEILHEFLQLPQKKGNIWATSL